MCKVRLTVAQSLLRLIRVLQTANLNAILLHAFLYPVNSQVLGVFVPGRVWPCDFLHVLADNALDNYQSVFRPSIGCATSRPSLTTTHNN